MAYENFPLSARQQVEAPPKPNWMALIAGILLIAFLSALAYIFLVKNKVEIQKVPQEIMPVVVSNQKNDLKEQLSDASLRYDMLKNLVGQKDSLNRVKDSEIAETKKRITFLLAKVNTTQAELDEARTLIASLKGSIESYKGEVETLSVKNNTLAEEKIKITKQKEATQTSLDAAKKQLKKSMDLIDVGTTLNASGFAITSIDERKSGKEKETLAARRVDKLRISFELGENRLASTGQKEIYILITGPDNTPLAVEAFGSGKFFLRDGSEKFYTSKLDVNYVQGQRQTVSFDWKQNSTFDPGEYKIQVYNNGFKIGEGIRYLKKS